MAGHRSRAAAPTSALHAQGVVLDMPAPPRQVASQQRRMRPSRLLQHVPRSTRSPRRLCCARMKSWSTRSGRARTTLASSQVRGGHTDPHWHRTTPHCVPYRLCVNCSECVTAYYEKEMHGKPGTPSKAGSSAAAVSPAGLVNRLVPARATPRPPVPAQTPPAHRAAATRTASPHTSRSPAAAVAAAPASPRPARRARGHPAPARVARPKIKWDAEEGRVAHPAPWGRGHLPNQAPPRGKRGRADGVDGAYNWTKAPSSDPVRSPEARGVAPTTAGASGSRPSGGDSATLSRSLRREHSPELHTLHTSPARDPGATPCLQC